MTAMTAVTAVTTARRAEAWNTQNAVGGALILTSRTALQ
jgi:hypothetical protein